MNSERGTDPLDIDRIADEIADDMKRRIEEEDESTVAREGDCGVFRHTEDCSDEEFACDPGGFDCRARKYECRGSFTG